MHEDMEHLSSKQRLQFRRQLLGWFRHAARDLPWRRTRDIYAVWVSEIMLQQTQVATVIPYYERFLSALPTVQHLAQAPQQDVLRLWEGLGYYRRARQMHEAACRIVQHHGGQFPRDVRQALELPGIGRYTAGAILSIATDQRLPILEANTIRLHTRLLGLRHDPTSSRVQKVLWQFAEDILPRTRTGIFNQALMELGATICLPKNPKCDVCPIAAHCAARRQGLQDELRVAARKIKFEARREAAMIVRNGETVLLRQCAPGQRWAGLWDFPRFQIPLECDGQLEQLLGQRTFELTGLRVQAGRHVTTIRHGVTRYRITLECYEARLTTSSESTAGSGAPSGPQRWLRAEELAELPLSTTGRKISHLLFPPALAARAERADNRQGRPLRPSDSRRRTSS